MPRIRFGSIEADSRARQSVLETLESAGVEIPFGCRSGSCQTCLLRARAGRPDPDAQLGLGPFEIAAGHFMSCIATVGSDLECGVIGDVSLRHSSEVTTVRSFEGGIQLGVVPWHEERAAAGRQCMVRVGESLGNATIGEGNSIWLRPSGDGRAPTVGTRLSISDSTGLAFVSSELDLEIDRAYVLLDDTSAITGQVIESALVREFDEVQVECVRPSALSPTPDGPFAGIASALPRAIAARTAVWAVGRAEWVMTIRGLAFRAGVPIRHITRATDRDRVPPV